MDLLSSVAVFLLIGQTNTEFRLIIIHLFILQYAFQQPGGTANEVELHSWVIHTGSVHSFQIQTITEDDFIELRNKFQFAPLGISTLSKLRFSHH